jgi:CxxC motif-containing protein (DUF1111 family)
MKFLKISLVFLFAVALVVPFTFTSSVEGQAATEAPSTNLDGRDDHGDGQSGTFNGFGVLGDEIDECVADPVPLRSFRDNEFIFSERESIDDGLGPVYNAQSCAECHQHPSVGAISQINEFRAGRLVNGNFVDAAGGTLINDRAIDARIVERINTGDTIRTFRTSLNLLGDGFVEAINSNDLVANANAQPIAQRGTVIQVPVLEDSGQNRVGRFGWKNQHASLVSFSADAYLNEMGITSPLQPTENTSNGNSVAAFDGVADPEDDGADIEAFAQFMRQTKVPGRGTINAQVTAGQAVFNQVGCAVCHTPSFTTAPAGTVINGGAFTVPAALGNKVIRPFGDFLLHDIGTGDGILQAPAPRNAMRTAPLWGVRTRNKLMHDGQTHTFFEAIQRHANQGAAARNAFNARSQNDQANLIAFLVSL